MNLLGKGDKKTTIISVVIFILAVLFIFHSFLYSPLVKKIEEEQVKLNEQKTKLEEAQRISGQLDKLQRENRRLEYQLAESSKRLPHEKEIPDLLKKITSLGNRTQVNFIYFRPQSVVTRDFYKEVPIKVSVRCSYHNLGMFLSELGQLERIVNASDIQIQPIVGKKGETISSTFLITTFTFSEGGGV